MLFKLLKIPAWFCLHLFCRALYIERPKALEESGPLLIACNHPNSFLDAIILAALFKKPIYSLARGDVFKRKWAAALLKQLNMLPVYRTSEGVENMEHNYSTFSACQEIFRQGGIVLIFSEGLCVNEWHLRPLMKGTARLALSSWESGIPLRILPTGINYSSFKKYGKEVHLLFTPSFGKADVDISQGFGKSLGNFNAVLREKLQPLVYEIPAADAAKLATTFKQQPSTLQKIILALPAACGWVAHAPVYFLSKKIALHFGGRNGHYDSIQVAVLFLLYPVYLLLIALFFALFSVPWWGLLFIVLPLLARATLVYRHT